MYNITSTDTHRNNHHNHQLPWASGWRASLVRYCPLYLAGNMDGSNHAHATLKIHKSSARTVRNTLYSTKLDGGRIEIPHIHRYGKLISI